LKKNNQKISTNRIRVATWAAFFIVIAFTYISFTAGVAVINAMSPILAPSWLACILSITGVEGFKSYMDRSPNYYGGYNEFDHYEGD